MIDNKDFKMFWGGSSLYTNCWVELKYKIWDLTRIVTDSSLLCANIDIRDCSLQL